MLLNELKKDQQLERVRFSNKFVNVVGEMYEKYGYGATVAFLLEKKEDRKSSVEANTLLKVIEKVKTANVPPSIGGFIIRKITSLKRG